MHYTGITTKPMHRRFRLQTDIQTIVYATYKDIVITFLIQIFQCLLYCINIIIILSVRIKYSILKFRILMTLSTSPRVMEWWDLKFKTSQTNFSAAEITFLRPVMWHRRSGLIHNEHISEQIKFPYIKFISYLR